MTAIPRREHDPLRICLVANCRFPIVEPFTGGLESMTWHLARELVRRGHEVSLFAAPGSDPSLGVIELEVDSVPAQSGRQDIDVPAAVEVAEHHAYLSLMLDLASAGDGFDVMHNNSLHYLPVAMARTLPMPMVTTLHTPPFPWLESAIRLDRGASSFAAVSQHTADTWAAVTDTTYVPNGIDVDRWTAGPGSSTAVWSGRLVAEKAPHHAVLAARRAGVPLVLAGPILDMGYYRELVEPLLGAEATYAGHLDQADLADLVGASSVALVTPVWDEPYGLVAAEALACGTPVAAYARGGLPEVIAPGTGRLALPGDVDDLARAITEAISLDRATCRAHAVASLSLGAMVDRYEDLYARMQDRRLAA
ncbi:glycosyltransferase family 4 protein [Nocardioides oleivorans]|uniref:Glycosyltransferase family 4 protein n=1 Tax=Nocardioides oleivorans TaxID=273676 RepID=A0A4V1RKB3_9ACTN|nr:glycosyltransferase family 4 protein [Nocardioides oleivorans]RYB91682.1 glycosyltransferase family 4 protein [Nocardioides oleivorans]